MKKRTSYIPYDAEKDKAFFEMDSLPFGINVLIGWVVGVTLGVAALGWIIPFISNQS